jgi:hypothetical protein
MYLCIFFLLPRTGNKSVPQSYDNRMPQRVIDVMLKLFHAIGVLLMSLWRWESASVTELKARMKTCKRYDTWRGFARLLDEEEGLGHWREAPEKRINMDLVLARVRLLAKKKRDESPEELLKTIRADIHRSTLGITNPSLYPYRTAAKSAISTYVNLMTHLIRSVAANESLEVAARYGALKDMDLAYGRSALMLHGGVALGAYHLGVIKGLYEAKLLPKVIFGNNTGALVAACVCCFEDIRPVLDGSGVNFDAFAKRGTSGSLRRKWDRLWSEGVLMDVSVLLQFAKDNLGEMTFDEAYRKTGYSLNINVCTRLGGGAVGSWLFNHVTTPRVLIYTAAVASCETAFLYGRTQLLARSISGHIVPFDPPAVQFSDRVVDFHINDAVERLQELFHVKLTIVSECTVGRLPFLCLGHRDDTLSRVGHFFTEEIWRCLAAFSRLGFLHSRLTASLQNISDRIKGDIVIFPVSTVGDLLKLLNNPDPSLLHHCVWRGEQQLWTRLPLLKSHIAIEVALYEAIRNLEDHHMDRIHLKTTQGSPLPSSLRRPSAVRFRADDDDDNVDMTPPPRLLQHTEGVTEPLTE